jgi:hypothetical protein
MICILLNITVKKNKRARIALQCEGESYVDANKTCITTKRKNEIMLINITST